MKPMDLSRKLQFRILLGAYLAVFIVGFWAAAARRSLIPENVYEAEQLVQDSTLATVILIFGQILWLAGVLGMLFLWSPSRYAFLAALLVLCLYSFSSVWHAHTLWEGLCTKVLWMLSGAVLTLVFFGPTKQLFGISDVSNKSLHSAPR
jgi:hypothetical protein